MTNMSISLNLLPTESVVKCNNFIRVTKITIYISTALFIYRPAQSFRVRVTQFL